MQIGSLHHTLNDPPIAGLMLPAAANAVMPSNATPTDLVRDAIAAANSGGGLIHLDAPIDEADLRSQLSAVDQLRWDVQKHSDPSAKHWSIRIRAALSPLAYDGVFYFRHGERVEPASSTDMRDFVERLMLRVRRRWSRRIRRVFCEPLALAPLADRHPPRPGSANRKQPNLQPVRIVFDPQAPALQPPDIERLYPWRQKDLLIELNRRFGRRTLNSYDIQAVRRQHRLDEHPEFVFNLPGAGRRYSPAAADWIGRQFETDHEFFRKARTADQEMLKLRRARPK